MVRYGSILTSLLVDGAIRWSGPLAVPELSDAAASPSTLLACKGSLVEPGRAVFSELAVRSGIGPTSCDLEGLASTRALWSVVIARDCSMVTRSLGHVSGAISWVLMLGGPLCRLGGRAAVTVGIDTQFDVEFDVIGAKTGSGSSTCVASLANVPSFTPSPNQPSGLNASTSMVFVAKAATGIGRKRGRLPVVRCPSASMTADESIVVVAVMSSVAAGRLDNASELSELSWVTPSARSVGGVSLTLSLSCTFAICKRAYV